MYLYSLSTFNIYIYRYDNIVQPKHILIMVYVLAYICCYKFLTFDIILVHYNNFICILF